MPSDLTLFERLRGKGRLRDIELPSEGTRDPRLPALDTAPDKVKAGIDTLKKMRGDRKAYRDRVDEALKMGTK